MQLCHSIRSAMAVGIGLLVGPVQAQEGEGQPRHTLRVELGAAQQPAVQFHLPDEPQAQLRYSARNVLLGMEYSVRSGEFYSISFGVTIFWTALRISGEVAGADSTGTYVAQESTRLPIFWYPFQRIPALGRSLPQDPLQLMVGLSRTVLQKDRHHLSLGLQVGAMPMANRSTGRGFFVWDPRDPDRAILAALVRRGGEVYPTLGIQCRMEHIMQNMDKVSISVESRMTLTNYYTAYVFRPDQPDGPFTERQDARFFWLGLRVGYGFTWGAPRKPRWVRLREERGLSTH